MNKIIEVEGKIEDIVIGENYDSVYIPFYEREGDEIIDGSLMYPIELLPKKGRYSVIVYPINFELRGVETELDQNVGNNVSVCTFSGRTVEKGRSRGVRLHDDSNQTPGFVTDQSEFLPEEFEDGDECFVTIEVHYPYEKQLEKHSEERIEEFRERFKNDVEDIRDMTG